MLRNVTAVPLPTKASTTAAVARWPLLASMSRPAESSSQANTSTHTTTSQQQHRELEQQQQRQPGSPFSDIGIEELRQQLDVFAAERNWQQFHTPRNLLLALVGEVGELSEIFQWRGEVPPGLPDFSPADRAHVGQELSDVLLYLIRLADVAGVDLGTAVRDKLAANAVKYPAEHCKGKADKYTAYANSSSKQQQDQQQQGKQQQDQQQGKQQPDQGVEDKQPGQQQQLKQQ